MSSIVQIKSMSIIGRAIAVKRAQERTQRQQRQQQRQQQRRQQLKEQLPTPRNYYTASFPTITFTSSLHWHLICCCFHDENTPSLSLNFTHGGFNCFACNARGGDVVAFHRLRYGLDFKEAMRQLVGDN